MLRGVRWVFLAVGIFAIVLTIGFYLQLAAATGLWMWPDGRLTYIFIASITAAIAAPVIWMGLSGEWGAAVGGAVNLCIQAVGISAFLAQLSLTNPVTHWPHVLLFGLFAVVNVGVFIWSWRYPLHDSRPTPRLVRMSFVVFTVVLLLVSIALLIKVPNVFPWPLLPETSVIIGWVFMGTFVYFAYASVRPVWGNAVGQLLGFLAYDVILIVPFIGHFADVLPEHQLSLIVYTGVVVYSGALAIYYCFIHPPTRLLRPAASPSLASEAQ